MSSFQIDFQVCFIGCIEIIAQKYFKQWVKIQEAEVFSLNVKNIL